MRNASLALYHYDSCPYCARVRSVIKDLGLDVEYRDIHKTSQHLHDLVRARGRQTVPVLRIVGAEGDEWMPESADIIAYLRRLPR